jgi:putative hydrolase of the HAD superfamily
MPEGALDWTRLRLVVFDVDGTLYRQSTLRRRMMKLLFLDAILRRSITSIRIIREYRLQRELLADEGAYGFEPILRRRVAERCGVPDQVVASVVGEWIERRPLAQLAGSLYPDIVPLFDAIRRSGRKIGILSDYPVRGKLEALGLEADYLVAAADPEVDVMKPDPRGLEHLMWLAGEGPETTLLIGDRPERDGEAARRAGVPVLLRSTSVPGYYCLEQFDGIASILRGAACE